MTTRLGEGGKRVDSVELLVVDRSPGKPRSFRSGLAASVLAGQEAAREREVRDVGDPELATERENALVVVSAEKVVVVLENRETRSSLFTRRAVCLCQLLGREVRAPDRSHLPCVDELVERAERVADRNRRVGPVQVVEIDVITPQPLERALERPAYRRRGGSAVTGLPGELRGEHDVVAASLEDLAEVALALSPFP